MSLLVKQLVVLCSIQYSRNTHAASFLSHGSLPNSARKTTIHFADRNTEPDTATTTPSITTAPLKNIDSINGIIFDMDGTLLKPCIDFPLMRDQIYSIADSDESSEKLTRGCVLEISQTLSPSGRERCRRVFEEIEQKAIDDMEMMEGACELMDFLDSKGVKRAVLTRNVLTSVDVMQDLFWAEGGVSPFYPAVARDTVVGEDGGVIASKPEPDAILYIADVWGCDVESVVMVGDSDADDIACANRARCGGSILIDAGLDNCSGRSGPQDVKELIPSVTVRSLSDIIGLFQD